jgi:hypothetical protein
MTNKRVREKRNGMMEPLIKGNIRMGKSMGKEFLFGMMTVSMKGSLWRIRFMAKGSIYGEMGEHIRGIGVIIGCMGVEFLPGRMGKSMKDNIRIIKNMDLVYFISRMGGDMKGFGKMESSMERDISRKRRMSVREFGKMVRELNGSISQRIKKQRVIVEALYPIPCFEDKFSFDTNIMLIHLVVKNVKNRSW